MIDIDSLNSTMPDRDKAPWDPAKPPVPTPGWTRRDAEDARRLEQRREREAEKETERYERRSNT